MRLNKRLPRVPATRRCDGAVSNTNRSPSTVSFWNCGEERKCIFVATLVTGLKLKGQEREAAASKSNGTRNIEKCVACEDNLVVSLTKGNAHRVLKVRNVLRTLVSTVIIYLVTYINITMVLAL